MARTYKYLDADDKKAVEAEVAERDSESAPVVDDSLAAAWEADHYAHSLLLAATTDEGERKIHAEAMAQIEKALSEAGR